MKKLVLLFLSLLLVLFLHAEDGYTLWLRYTPVKDPQLLAHYRSRIRGIKFTGNSPTLAVAREELNRGLHGLLGQKFKEQKTGPGNINIGTTASSPALATVAKRKDLTVGGPDAFLIESVNDKGETNITIAGNTDKGVLYGVFHFLRLLQPGQSLKNLSIVIQEKEAVWWRNACLLYFQTFSGKPIPAQYDQPDKSLEYYKSLQSLMPRAMDKQHDLTYEREVPNK